MSPAAAGSTDVCRTTALLCGRRRTSDLWSRTHMQFEAAARDETWAVLANLVAYPDGERARYFSSVPTAGRPSCHRCLLLNTAAPVRSRDKAHALLWQPGQRSVLRRCSLSRRRSHTTPATRRRSITTSSSRTRVPLSMTTANGRGSLSANESPTIAELDETSED